MPTNKTDYVNIQPGSDLEASCTEDEQGEKQQNCGLVQPIQLWPNLWCTALGAIGCLVTCAAFISLHNSTQPSTMEDLAKKPDGLLDWVGEEAQTRDYVISDSEPTFDASQGGAADGAGNENAAVEDVPKEAGPTGFAELAPPLCKCASYKAGATASDTMLCASPWGEPTGHGQQCSRPGKDGTCPRTTHKCTTVATIPPEPRSPCLCAFDIDRTLTAMQAYAASPKGVVHGSSRSKCPNTTTVPNTYDWAFGGGQLTLSALSTVGVAETTCGECYVGITSRGQAQGTMSKNRAALLNAITTPPFSKLAAQHPDALKWSNGARSWTKSQLDVAGFAKNGYGLGRIHSPLVVWQYDKLKQWAIEGVLEWYASKGVNIARERVFFFDDRADNVQYFKGTGMNAHQISCASRASGNVGKCGARPEEIKLTPGITVCHGSGQNATSTHGGYRAPAHAWDLK